MAKTAFLPTGSINHLTDTVITLPKSGKTIVVSKDISSDKLAGLDNFFANHSASPSGRVQPNLLSCNQHQVTYMEMENIYQTIPGKQLGIWDDVRQANWPTYYNIYGFNEIFLGWPSEFYTANVNNTMFKADSMLGNISKTNYQADAHALQSLGVKRLYIDEPMDAYPPAINLTVSLLVNYTNWIYNNIPGSTVGWSTYETKGAPYFSWYQSALQQTYNSYIMCDQYNPPSDQQYDWLHYAQSDWFGSTRANVHGNWADCLYDYDGNGYTYNNLFQDANALGINQVWLFADYSWDPTYAVASFSNSAWQGGWLLQLERQVTVFYSCSGNCTVCDWPAGSWSPYAYVYGPYQWVHN